MKVVRKVRKGISKEDLKDLLSLARQIAQMHSKYIEAGFEPEEIAQTFAEVYHHEFAVNVGPKALEILQKEFHRLHSGEEFNRGKASGNICLSMSASFIDVMIKKLKEEDKKVEEKHKKDAQKHAQEELAEAEAHCKKHGL